MRILRNNIRLSIRATGSGMAAAVGRIGGIFGPLLVGSLLTAGYEFGFIFGIFCVAIIIGVLAVVFLGKRNETTRIRIIQRPAF